MLKTRKRMKTLNHMHGRALKVSDIILLHGGNVDSRKDYASARNHLRLLQRRGIVYRYQGRNDGSSFKWSLTQEGIRYAFKE